jgi:hypothetical protein
VDKYQSKLPIGGAETPAGFSVQHLVDPLDCVVLSCSAISEITLCCGCQHSIASYCDNPEMAGRLVLKKAIETNFLSD